MNPVSDIRRRDDGNSIFDPEVQTCKQKRNCAAGLLNILWHQLVGEFATLHRGDGPCIVTVITIRDCFGFMGNSFDDGAGTHLAL